MDKIFLVASITFKDLIRNKALHGIYFASIFLFLANIAITALFSWELGKVAVDVGLSIVSLAGLLFIFFLATGSVAGEITEKTVYFVLARPVTRTQYVLGKYLGLAGVLFLSCVVIGVSAALSVRMAIAQYPLYQPVNYSWGTFFLAWLFLLLSLLVTLSFSLFWTMVSSHAYTAMLFSILTYCIGSGLETTRYLLLRDANFADKTVLRWLISAMVWVFPNLKAFDLKTTAAYGLEVTPWYLVTTAAYGILYIFMMLFLAAQVMNRRELG